ncbi:MAG: ABC transporter permease [Alphaproteobacteria bacterium]|nr:ABC transporter permease [Alphaproteobacteria bacterium]
MTLAKSQLYAGERAERRWIGLCTAFVSFYLVLPILMAIAVSFTSRSRIQFPPVGFSWRWYEAALANREFVDGLVMSTLIATGSAIVSALAGTGAAMALRLRAFPARTGLQLLVGLPIALPAVVVGLGLLFLLPTYGLKQGLVPAVLSHAVIGTSYVTYLVGASFANFDPAIERASLDLGASRWQTFRLITLPIIRPGIITGTAFAFLLSFDNVSLSLFVTRGETLPLKLMQHIQFIADPAIAAVSTMLVGASLIFLIVFRRALSERQLSGLQRR